MAYTSELILIMLSVIMIYSVPMHHLGKNVHHTMTEILGCWHRFNTHTPLLPAFMHHKVAIGRVVKD